MENMEIINDNIMEFRKVSRIRKQNERDIALAQAEMERTTALAHVERERATALAHVEREQAIIMADIEMENLENEMKLEPTRDKVDIMKCNLASKKELKKKAWLYLALAIFYSTISATMSVLGLAHQESITNLSTTFRGKYGVASILFSGLQIGIIIYSQSAHCIEKDFFRSYQKIRIAQKAIICSSIFCNYQFMCEMIGNDGLATKIICAILSASCDIMSLNFSELATNIKFRIYTHSDDLNMTGGLFNKLYIILFGSLLAKIDKKYNQRIQELKVARFGQANEPDDDNDDDTDDDETKKSAVKYDEQGLPGIGMYIEKVKNLKPGTQITRGMLGIDDIYQWQLVRDGLKENGLVFCEKKKTYRTEYDIE